MNIIDLQDILNHIQQASLSATRAVGISKDRDIDLSMKLSNIGEELDNLAQDVQKRINQGKGKEEPVCDQCQGKGCGLCRDDIYDAQKETKWLHDHDLRIDRSNRDEQAPD